MKDTAARILEAAIRVFARDGVSGATTREIARLARVNEVTLFRNFHSKDELLRQVVLHSMKRYVFDFADAPVETAADLRRTIRAFAAVLMRKLRENEAFIRTFYGELERQPKLCRRLFVEAGQPVRQRFIDYLRVAQKKRLIRRGLDLPTTADALTGLLVVGVLRRPLTDPEYSNEQFSETALELFLRGIEP
jgi:AcrR family transcriptional regulator